MSDTTADPHLQLHLENLDVLYAAIRCNCADPGHYNSNSSDQRGALKAFCERIEAIFRYKNVMAEVDALKKEVGK